MASMSSSSAAGTSSSASAAAADSPYAQLELARKTLEDRLAKDEKWLSVGDAFIASSSSEYIVPPNDSWAPMQKVRSAHLPDRLFESDLMQTRCMMGLLPEINRAWVSIDHRLFLWDWSNESDISTFEELSDVIVGVGLVKPRKGVFVDSISHVLVLATPNDVSLVGLGFNDARELTFYMTGLSCPTDGISFSTIRGTSNGRIFLSSIPNAAQPGGFGGDGCLYELGYQSAEGWFSKKCALANLTAGGFTRALVPTFLKSFTAVPAREWVVALEVDMERGLLYTLLENKTIEMYQVPGAVPVSGAAGGDGPPYKVARCTDILRQAQTICPGSPMLDARNFDIVALEVVSAKEAGSSKVGLVAVTSTGVRLYFTHQRRGYSVYVPSNLPANLDLCHVRTPPVPAQGQQPSPTTVAFNNVSQARFATGGFFLAANSFSDEVDVLLATSPDIGRVWNSVLQGSTSRIFSEIAAEVQIEGRTWAIAEVTQRAPGIESGLLSELATQAIEPRREWVVLTHVGSNIVTRQRPVDTLLGVLARASMSGPAGANAEFKLFIDSFGRDQTCAMLLMVAAGNTNCDVRASAIAETAKSAFLQAGERPVSSDGGYGAVTTTQQPPRNMMFSGRHEALAYYLARLMRPLWRVKITKPAPTPTSPKRQVANVADSTLIRLQRDLSALRTFVEKEWHLFSLPIDSTAGRVDPATLTEQHSLEALRLLLAQIVEAISFVLLLVDYNLPEIVGACQPEVQTDLSNLTYEGLLTTQKGRDLARSLVSAVIAQQLGQQLSIDAISEILQQRCGSFCSSDDVLLHKALQAQRRAKDTPDRSERIDSLRESLRLFSKATKELSFDRMKEICTEYQDLSFPTGIVELVLTCANDWDVARRGEAYWMDGQPADDPREGAYKLRLQCYEVIFRALEHLDSLLNQAAARSSYEDIDSLRSNAYTKALSARDECFHFALYDWYLGRRMTDQLLDTRAMFLEKYLSQQPAVLERVDLLWQLYVRTGRYAQAASLLAQLAETTEFDIALATRVQYLSLTVANAKSSLALGRAELSSELLTDVEERLEVAQVQVEVFRELDQSSLPDDEKEPLLARLDSQLLTITELYSGFAAPYEMLEVELLIFHVSDHQRLEDIEATWREILRRESEAPEGRRLDCFTAKLSELARRFGSSDTAFPLAAIVDDFTRYSYSDPAMNATWLPLALHDGGVAWEAIFQAFDGVLSSGVELWTKGDAQRFLMSSLATLLERWFEDATTTRGGPAFAATDVDAALGKYTIELKSPSQEAQQLRRRFEALQKDIRRRF